MCEFRADLHCHSYFSDGSLSPAELIALAKEVGLKGLSITDHDTVGAYESAIPLAKEAGIDLIVGVEFSTEFELSSIHILGYGFNPQHPAIVQFCERHLVRRLERNAKILIKLAERKIFITDQDIEDACLEYIGVTPKTLGRPHIALALKYKGYVSDFRDAFKHYIGENKVCFVKGEFFPIQETIDLIHAAGGLAVIAHPHLISSHAILNKLLKLNFDGIECYYGRQLATYHKRWLEIAQKKNWLVTGGSDFHGATRPNIMLGCSWVDQETFQKLTLNKN